MYVITNKEKTRNIVLLVSMFGVVVLGMLSIYFFFSEWQVKMKDQNVKSKKDFELKLKGILSFKIHLGTCGTWNKI